MSTSFVTSAFYGSAGTYMLPAHQTGDLILHYGLSDAAAQPFSGNMIYRYRYSLNGSAQSVTLTAAGWYWIYRTDTQGAALNGKQNIGHGPMELSGNKSYAAQFDSNDARAGWVSRANNNVYLFDRLNSGGSVTESYSIGLEPVPANGFFQFF